MGRGSPEAVTGEGKSRRGKRNFGIQSTRNGQKEGTQGGLGSRLARRNDLKRCGKISFHNRNEGKWVKNFLNPSSPLGKYLKRRKKNLDEDYSVTGQAREKNNVEKDAQRSVGGSHLQKKKKAGHPARGGGENLRGGSKYLQEKREGGQGRQNR